MKKVFMFLAQGFEDIEALIPLDVLRRGGVDVKTVSVGKDYMVTSAHGVDIKADFMFNEINREEADLLMLPGGMPGATNLYEHKELCQALLKHNEKGIQIIENLGPSKRMWNKQSISPGHPHVPVCPRVGFQQMFVE